MLRILLMLLALGAPAFAEDNSDFQPGDALYAPEEESGTAQSASASSSAGSYYSSARIEALDYGHGMKPLEGAEIFIDGRFLGKSPLDLSGFLVNKPAMTLSARLPGYNDAAREAFKIPAEGNLGIAMVGDNAASWYTMPSWIAGLAMLGGAVAAYSQNNSQVGIALVGGGVGVIALSQAVARLFHLPRLESEAAALNAKSDPRP